MEGEKNRRQEREGRGKLGNTKKQKMQEIYVKEKPANTEN